MKLVLSVCCFYYFISSAVCMPAWDSIFGRGSISSLVPGATYVEALGPAGTNELFTMHLSSHRPGELGNLTVTQNSKSPSLFYIHQDQLWQFVNETTIFPVNVVNVTRTSDFPLQLVLSKKRSSGAGSWRWRGTMLYYEQGARNNQGLFHYCTPSEGGVQGVYMFLEPSPAPPGCNFMTLHSFQSNSVWKSRARP